jgi:hypothetical protein
MMEQKIYILDSAQRDLDTGMYRYVLVRNEKTGADMIVCVKEGVDVVNIASTRDCLVREYSRKRGTGNVVCLGTGRVTVGKIGEGESAMPTFWFSLTTADSVEDAPSPNMLRASLERVYGHGCAQ